MHKGLLSDEALCCTLMNNMASQTQQWFPIKSLQHQSGCGTSCSATGCNPPRGFSRATAINSLFNGAANQHIKLKWHQQALPLRHSIAAIPGIAGIPQA